MATATEAKPKKPAVDKSDSQFVVIDDVLDQVVRGGQGAIGATRRFFDQIDESLLGSSESPSRGHDVIDAALEMSDRMVESGGDAVRGIVRGLRPSS